MPDLNAGGKTVSQSFGRFGLGELNRAEMEQDVCRNSEKSLGCVVRMRALLLAPHSIWKLTETVAKEPARKLLNARAGDGDRTRDI